MADTLSSTSTLDNLLPTYFAKKALPRLVASGMFYRFAEKTPLPKGEGKTVRWNGWTNFAVASAALTEGTNPSAAAVSSRKVEATIAQYGRAVKTSDLVEYTSSLDVMKGVVDQLGDSAGLTLDNAIQLAVFKNDLVSNGVATANTILSAWMSAVQSSFHAGDNAESNEPWAFPVVFGTTATRLSAVSKAAPLISAKMSVYALKKAVKELRAKNAKTFADGYFKVIMNSDSMSDLADDPKYIDWVKGTSFKPLDEGEAVSPVAGCRVYMSNNLPAYDATAHEVDLSFVFGMGAYGVTEFGSGGKGFQVIIKRPGANDTSNPLDMYGYMSYKMNVAGAALNVSAGRTLFTHAKP